MTVVKKSECWNGHVGDKLLSTYDPFDMGLKHLFNDCTDNGEIYIPDFSNIGSPDSTLTMCYTTNFSANFFTEFCINMRLPHFSLLTQIWLQHFFILSYMSATLLKYFHRWHIHVSRLLRSFVSIQNVCSVVCVDSEKSWKSYWVRNYFETWLSISKYHFQFRNFTS